MYISGHGYGHCTRTATFLIRLLTRVKCDLDVTTSCPRSLWPRALGAHTLSWRALACDSGVVQANDLTVDHDATSSALDRWQRTYEHRLGEETARLRGKVDAVLADVPPLGLAAAHAAAVPGFALANFSWDWIYAQMGFELAAAEAARAYRSARALFELEPGTPMDAFARKVEVGVLGRTPTTGREQTRARLEVNAQERLVLLALREPALCALPAPSPGIRYICSVPGRHNRSDVIPWAGDLEFDSIVGAADAIVAKSGYSIIADAAACGTPLLYVLREGFPEDEFLARWLGGQPATRRIDAHALAAGQWRPALEEVLNGPRPAPMTPRGVEAAVETLASALG